MIIKKNEPSVSFTEGFFLILPLMQNKNLNLVKLILRIGISGTFLGHGILAIGINAIWYPFFTAVGIGIEDAKTLMPIIGVLDLFIAFIVLIYPIKIVLIWAIFWTFTTALMRPLSGTDIWPFIERFSFWAAPLALLVLNGIPKKLKDLLKV